MRAAGAATLVVALLVVLGAQIAGSSADARRALEQRYALRAELAGGFVSAYVDEVVADVAARAASTMTGADPAAAFDEAVASFGFDAAVLLDADGVLLAVEPASPSMIGTEVASRYEHLSSAVAGTAAVSNVVPSAVEGRRIVAFAVPFESETGRRVFSGGFAVEETFLVEFLDSATPFRHREVFLLDAEDRIVAAAADAGAAVTLADAAPELAAAVEDGPAGSYVDGGTSMRFASAPVPGTSWRLVTAVAADELFAPLSGTRTGPWMVFAGLCVAAAVAAAALGVAARQHERLVVLSSTDALTGLANRRSVADRIAAGVQAPIAVLLVDVDHFKAVNDTLGHAEGDRVLVDVAAELRELVRAGDVAGRWGGEEFVVILAETGLAEAMAVAERLRASVEASSPVTVSVGVAAGDPAASGSGVDALIGAADRALYRAKSEGRNRVVAG